MSKKSARPVSAALKGYLYQKDVSVWIALKFMVLDEACLALEVEPWTEEDLEIEVASLTEASPGVAADAEGYTLSLQVKSRSSGNWSLNDFKGLLQHGKKRPSAIQQLENKAVKYLLVTDASLHGNPNELSVHNVGSWPKKSPKSVDNLIDLSSHGRVAILPNLSRELLNGRVKAIILDILKVPHSDWEACYTALGQLIFSLMKNGGGPATREMVLKVVQDHNGYLGAFSESDLYVPPNNYSEIQDKLASSNAVVIVGPSGTGKTWLSKSLVGELMDDDTRPLSLVKITQGPSEIEAFSESGPVLFDIEDPWGKYEASPNGADWAERLHTILRSAKPDRMFVVTSRSDFFEAAEPKRLTQSLVYLLPENYSQEDRARIFNHRLTLISQDLQRVALSQSEYVLTSLETPLELDKFFVLLTDPKPDDLNDAQFAKYCADGARGDAIEDSLVRQITANNYHLEAGLFWAMMKAFEPLNKGVLNRFLQVVVSMSSELADKLDHFSIRLIAGFFLRRKEGAITYRHNQVEKGLVKAIAAQKYAVNATLSDFVNRLLTLENNEFRTAAETIAGAIFDQESLTLTLSTPARRVLDQTLTDSALSAATKDTPNSFKRLSDLSGASHLPGRLARWLSNKSHDGTQAFMRTHWAPLEDDEKFYKTLSANASTAQLLEKYILNVMPSENWMFYKGFVERAYRLSPSVGGVFRKACIESFGHPGFSSPATLIEGALRELDRSQPVLQDALQTMKTIREYPENQDQLWSDINDEYPDGYSAHLGERQYEEIYSAEQFVEKYIEAQRAQNYWQDIKPIGAVYDGLYVWIQVLGKDDLAPFEEIAFVFEAAKKLNLTAHFWDILSVRKDVQVCALAVDTIVSSPNPDARFSAAQYWSQDSASVSERLYELAAAHSFKAIVRTAFDLNRARPVKGRSAYDEFVAHLDVEHGCLVQWINGGDLAVDDRPEPSVIAGFLDASDRDFHSACLSALIRLDQNMEPVLVGHLAETHAPDYRISNWLRDLSKLAAEYNYEDAMVVAFSSPFSSTISEAIKGFKLEQFPLPDEVFKQLGNPSHSVIRTILDRIQSEGAALHKASLQTLIGNNIQVEPDLSTYTQFEFACEAYKLLIGACDDFNEADAEHFYKTSIECDDEYLALNMLKSALTYGGEAIAKKVFSLLLDDTVGYKVRENASAALSVTKHQLTADAIKLGEAKRLLAKAPLKIAVPAAIVLGGKVHSDNVAKLTEFLGKMRVRPGLLIPFLHGIYMRDDGLDFNEQLRSLSGDLAERISTALNDGLKLPRSGLDSIGHVKLLDALIDYYGDELFVPKPK